MNFLKISLPNECIIDLFKKIYKKEIILYKPSFSEELPLHTAVSFIANYLPIPEIIFFSATGTNSDMDGKLVIANNYSFIKPLYDYFVTYSELDLKKLDWLGEKTEYIEPVNSKVKFCNLPTELYNAFLRTNLKYLLLKNDNNYEINFSTIDYLCKLYK